jgi:hypothetical protein
MIVLHLQGASSVDTDDSSLDICKKSSLPREVDTILAHDGLVRLASPGSDDFFGLHFRALRKVCFSRCKSGPLYE